MSSIFDLREWRGGEGGGGYFETMVFLTLSLLENFLELGEGGGSRRDRRPAIFASGKEGGFVLRTGTEDLAASIATAGELGVVAVPAVDLVHLATELFVHQGHSAPVAQETGLVPMLILVRQILQNETFGFFPPGGINCLSISREPCSFLSKRVRWKEKGRERRGRGEKKSINYSIKGLEETKLWSTIILR